MPKDTKPHTGGFSILQIYETYKTDVFRFALSLTRHIDLSQDITQDVFVRLIDSADTIENTDKVKSWLLTTTKNAAINALRKRSFEAGETHETGAADFAAAPAGDSTSQPDIYQAEFFSMLDCLDAEDRQIVVLHIVNGLKHNEIASVFGLHPGAVRQRYTRALKRIRESLREGDENE